MSPALGRQRTPRWLRWLLRLLRRNSFVQGLSRFHHDGQIQHGCDRNQNRNQAEAAQRHDKQFTEEAALL